MVKFKKTCVFIPVLYKHTVILTHCNCLSDITRFISVVFLLGNLISKILVQTFFTKNTQFPSQSQNSEKFHFTPPPPLHCGTEGVGTF